MRQWFNRKLLAVELKANPRIRSLGFHRSSGAGYFEEPHASVNQDFTRVLFNSDWGSADGDIDAWMLHLPAEALVDSRIGEDAPFTVSLAASSVSQGQGTYRVSTNRRALCRAATGSGYPWVVLYDALQSSEDGLSHTKTVPVQGAEMTTWVVCRDEVIAGEQELAVTLRAGDGNGGDGGNGGNGGTTHPLSVSVLAASLSGYEASYRLATDQPAACRQSNQSGYPFAALYQDLASLPGGLEHQMVTTTAMPDEAVIVYAVCRATTGGAEREVEVLLAPGGGTAAFAINVVATARNGYEASYAVSTTRPARCMHTWEAGAAGYFDALYTPLASADGLSHMLTLTLGTSQPTTVFAVCRETASAEVLEQAVALP